MGLVFTTIVNIFGAQWAARVAGAVVIIELIACCVIVVGFAFNIHRGPGVIFESQGTGAGHTTGYFGALLVALMAGGYSYFGFESAATLAEEVRKPRAVAPKTLIRALGLVILSAILLATLALMAVPDIKAPELATIGMPYVFQSTLGKTVGDLLLLCVAIAVLGAITALQATAGVRCGGSQVARCLTSGLARAIPIPPRSASSSDVSRARRRCSSRPRTSASSSPDRRRPKRPPSWGG